MTYPPAFAIAAASPAVTGLLGSNPTRFWPPGMAPQNETRPYAVFQTVYGTPENTLSCPPDIDLFGVQIDAYGKTLTEAREVLTALTEAFEAENFVVSGWNGEEREPATLLYRAGATVEFWVARATS